jgi:hypothetical protein
VTKPSLAPRNVLSAIVGLLLLSAAVLFSTSPASASSGSAGTSQVTFGVEPATATAPDARPNLSYGVTPGSTVRDHVAVVNFSTGPLTLTVYATDAVNTSSGGFSLLDGGQKPQDAGAWTSVDGHPAGAPVTVHVPARHGGGPGFVILPVLVHVPAGTGPGDHVGGVVAVLSTIGTNTEGAKVRLDQRVATRLFVRVSGTARPRLTIEGLTATYHPGAGSLGAGTVTLSYTVRNRGNVSLGAHQAVRVSGLLGGAGSVPTVADVPLLLPGASLHQSVQVSGVGPLVRLGATVTLHPTHPAGSVDPGLPDRIVAHTSFWAVPWAWILVLLLAIAGLVLLGRRQRRVAWQRRHRSRGGTPAGAADDRVAPVRVSS